MAGTGGDGGGGRAGGASGGSARLGTARGCSVPSPARPGWGRQEQRPPPPRAVGCCWGRGCLNLQLHPPRSCYPPPPTHHLPTKPEWSEKKNKKNLKSGEKKPQTNPKPAAAALWVPWARRAPRQHPQTAAGSGRAACPQLCGVRQRAGYRGSRSKDFLLAPRRRPGWGEGSGCRHPRDLRHRLRQRRSRRVSAAGTHRGSWKRQPWMGKSQGPEEPQGHWC